ncbi:unnamed protein product [Scytosiphon promiscuus]
MTVSSFVLLEEVRLWGAMRRMSAADTQTESCFCVSLSTLFGAYVRRSYWRRQGEGGGVVILPRMDRLLEEVRLWSGMRRASAAVVLVCDPLLSIWCLRASDLLVKAR